MASLWKMSKKEFFKSILKGVLIGCFIFVIIEMFFCYIDNQVDYDSVIDELLIEASEDPDKFTDEEIIELLLY